MKPGNSLERLTKNLAKVFLLNIVNNLKLNDEIGNQCTLHKSCHFKQNFSANTPSGYSLNIAVKKFKGLATDKDRSLMGNKELILGKTNHVFKPISEDLE